MAPMFEASAALANEGGRRTETRRRLFVVGVVGQSLLCLCLSDLLAFAFPFFALLIAAVNEDASNRGKRGNDRREAHSVLIKGDETDASNDCDQTQDKGADLSSGFRFDVRLDDSRL